MNLASDYLAHLERELQKLKHARNGIIHAYHRFGMPPRLAEDRLISIELQIEALEHKRMTMAPPVPRKPTKPTKRELAMAKLRAELVKEYYPTRRLGRLKKT